MLSRAERKGATAHVQCVHPLCLYERSSDASRHHIHRMTEVSPASNNHPTISSHNFCDNHKLNACLPSCFTPEAFTMHYILYSIQFVLVQPSSVWPVRQPWDKVEHTQSASPRQLRLQEVRNCALLYLQDNELFLSKWSNLQSLTYFKIYLPLDSTFTSSFVGDEVH